uniref:Uncharacterized protein n=1 Tax=Syphacia muris TaxID=451379 RepID=A0A0N5B1G3_9BILA
MKFEQQKELCELSTTLEITLAGEVISICAGKKRPDESQQYNQLPVRIGRKRKSQQHKKCDKTPSVHTRPISFPLRDACRKQQEVKSSASQYHTIKSLPSVASPHLQEYWKLCVISRFPIRHVQESK